MQSIFDFAKRLGYDSKANDQAEATPLPTYNIEAGKAGYNQYLADVEAEKAAKAAKEEAEKPKKWWEKISQFAYENITNAQNRDMGGFKQAIEYYQQDDSYKRPSDKWTDDERWAFGEKYANNKDEAYAFAEQVNNAYAQKSREDQAQKISDWTNKNTVNKWVGSAASLGINAVAGGAGYLDALAQKAGRGKVVQHDFLMPHEVSGKIQDTVATGLNERYGTVNFLGGERGWGDVYGLGMSIGQSTLAGVTGGSAGALVQFFGMAASQGVTDALERGATSEQALAFGTVSGLAEAIPEMISIKSLLGIASAEGVQNVFKAVAKQAGEEALEEFETSVINEVADRWIMGGKSQFALTVQELMASGMTQAQAENAAWKQTFQNLTYDVITGAASGGISGAGAASFQKVNQKYLQTKKNAEAKETLTPKVNELIEEGKKYKPTEKRSSNLEKKIAEGKEASGYELRMLASEISNASRDSDVETLRKAIVEKMKAEGLTDNQAKRLGEIALNKAIGNEVSALQNSFLKNNAAAMKVYNQMDTDNMLSGYSDSEWTKDTPLAKLKAESGELQKGIEKRLNNDKTEYDQSKIVDKSGKAVFEKSSADSKLHLDGISSELTKNNVAQLKAIEKLANELGVDIHVYETILNENGERVFVDKDGNKVTSSGFYDPKNKSIHIDLRAGNKGEGTMLYTASHELVHYMKDISKEHYDALEQLVTDALIKGGKSIETLMEAQRQKALENGQNLTDEEIREEMIADACQSFLASKSAIADIKALKTKNKSLWTALKKFFTTLFTKLNKIYKTVDPDSAEGKYIADMRNSVKNIRDAFMEGVTAAGEKTSADNKNSAKQETTEKVKSQARNISKITAEMTDAERYEELKNKKITAPYYNGEVDKLITKHSDELFGKTKQEAKKAVISIAKTLNISGTQINFDDVDVKVQVSNSNLSKSISQDATPEQMAKLLPILVPVAKTSIHVERHANRYYFDNDTVYFDNLLGAYVDNDSVIPIRFGLKHSGMGITTLYVFVDQNAINRTSLDEIKNSTGRQDATPDNSGVNNLHRRATYSLAQIVEFVNSKDLLRYIPDQMLDKEQKNAKWEAISETIKKTNDKNDKKYSEYIAKGDDRSAQQIVKAAAKANGYTDVVYHGTKAFGFTEFDTEKSDDKRSLFAAGSTELAQTYSGKHGTKRLSDNKKIDGLSNEEVVKQLNMETASSYEGAEMQTEYEIMHLKDVNKLITEVNDGIDTLQNVFEGKIKEYADKMARDFDDTDAKTHSRLIEANELLKSYDYKRLSTPLYVLLHYTDALESNPEVAELEYKIRLMNKLTDADTANGVVVEKDLGGYGITILTFDKAREKLKGLISSGNYALYGKPGKQLVIDAKGQNWNNIKGWIQSVYRSTKDTYVKKDDMYYRLYDIKTNEQIFHGRIEITDRNKDMSIDSMHPIMVQKANNALAIRSEYIRTTRDIAKFAKDEGYDSIKFENLVDNGGMGEDVESGDVYVYFNPSDLKSADVITYDENDKIIPISQRFNSSSKDIRYQARSTITPGVMQKTVADLSHNKVYSRKEAFTLLKDLGGGNLSAKSLDKLSEDLWIGLNKCTSAEERNSFAELMAETIVDRMLVDETQPNPEWQQASEEIAYFKSAINKLSFTDEQVTELKHILDVDGYKSLRARWGFKSRKSANGIERQIYPLDMFIADIAAEIPGMEHLGAMHPAEALVEIDKKYAELSEKLKNKYESEFSKMPDDTISFVKNSIEDVIAKSFSFLGTESKYNKVLSEKLNAAKEQIDFWKAENTRTRQYAKWSGILTTKANQIKELKKGTFYNATQHKQDLFKDSIEELSKIQWRGNLISVDKVREIFANLSQWYTKDNPMIFDKAKSANENIYDDGVATAIEFIATQKAKKLTVDEYEMIYEVMNHLYVLMRNYNKVFFQEKWQEAPDLAKSFMDIMREGKRNDGAIKRLASEYGNAFFEPMTIARMSDGYNENGFYTTMMEEFRKASINASVGEMNLRKQYDEFIDNNKKYLTNAAKETVKYRGYDVPKMHLIGLYMTMKRKHAWAGIALNGFEFQVKNKWWDSTDTVSVPGLITDGDNVTQADVEAAIQQEISKISKEFTEVDKQYIEILEKLFNEDLRNLKANRDIERKGYTNATLDYYYPIMRAGIAKTVDTSEMTDAQNRATNASFNKNTVKGARQKLVIISADAMVNKHITDVCKYAYMSPAIEAYDVLTSVDIGGNPNNPDNIASFIKHNKVWEKSHEYFKKIVSDMQGIRSDRSAAEDLLESVRGSYAKFQLGLSLKVLCSQFSSVIAASDIIRMSSILSVKQYKTNAADIEQYCPLAAVRSYDKTVIKAMSVSDKVGKGTEKFTALIGCMDKFVVNRLFVACQVEAQKLGHGKIGTDANKVAAGRLLEKVIIETQQNSYATERSAAMRSTNELLRTITMFTADAMKITGRVIDAYGELRALKRKGADKGAIKAARRKLARTMAVSISISAYMVGIGFLFKWIYGKDEDDENLLLTAIGDLFGNIIGALPIISDLYDYIVNGYEVETPVFDTFNNIISSIGNISSDVGKLVTGEDVSMQKCHRDLRSMIYGVGQLLGVPFRNVYNLTYGIIDKFSPTSSYKIDNFFYESNMVTDFNEAVEDGDEGKTNYILGIIYDERVGTDVNKSVKNELIRLTKKEYKVLPKTVAGKITRNGIEYEISSKQAEEIRLEYSKVNAEIEKLIASSYYQSNTDEKKAELINYYHDYYYNVAIDKVMFNKREDKYYVVQALGMLSYTKVTYATKGITADKDSKGNTISGSKKEKIIAAVKKSSLSKEKQLLYIASLGYKLTDEESKTLCDYLNKTYKNASTRKKLAEICGFDYKNGKIVFK